MKAYTWQSGRIGKGIVVANDEKTRTGDFPWRSWSR